MEAVQHREVGGPEVLELVDRPDPVPGPRDVVVRVRVCALNRLDVVQRRGWFHLPGFSLPHVPGTDVAGEVVAVGGEVAAVRVGDRVVVDPSLAGAPEGSALAAQASLAGGGSGVLGGTTDGGYAELCLAPETHCHLVPEHVSFEAAATFPTAWVTAAHALFAVGELTAGETVLVHAAGSGVSVAAIQLATRAGATVLATAGTDEKAARSLGLGAAHACNNRTTDIAGFAREVTGGRGVDLVLDHVGAALFGPSLAALAVGGRLVSVGNTSGDAATIPSLGQLFHNRLRILGSDLYTPAEFAAVWATFCAGNYQTPIDRAYPLGGAAEAHARLEANAAFGKLLLLP